MGRRLRLLGAEGPAARGDLRRPCAAHADHREPRRAALGSRGRPLLPPPARHRQAPGRHRGLGQHRHRHRVPGHLQDEPPRLPGAAAGDRPAREPGDDAPHRLRSPAHPPRPGPLPGHGQGGDRGLRQDRHVGHGRHGPQHPLHALRGEAVPRAPVQDRPRRRAHAAPVPHGPHPRRPDHERDQARGRHRVEADRLRRDPARGPAGRAPRPRRGRDPRSRRHLPAARSGPGPADRRRR